MKYSIIFLTLLGSLNQVSAQNKTFTISLYYAINETESTINFARLDSLMATEIGNNATIEIYGYADFLHTSVYNQNLSLKRATIIKDYLLSKKNELKVNKCVGMGENKSIASLSSLGDPLQRRVDVVVVFVYQGKKIGNRENITHQKKQPPVVNTKKQLNDLAKGESITFEGLNFIPGRHVLVKSAIPILETVLET